MGELVVEDLGHSAMVADKNAYPNWLHDAETIIAGTRHLLTPEEDQLKSTAEQ